jgi:transposase-like protein
MKKLAECMLAAELKHHLLAHAGQGTGKFGNYRNGSTPKTVSTPSGELDLAIPRVRFSTFVPRLIPRYQRRLPGFDDSLFVLYARGLDMHALQSRLQELYDTHAWAELCDTVTDEVLFHTRKWQARRLERSCALIYFDALQTRRRTESLEMEAPLFFALGMRTDGRKDFFGFWIERPADTGFWCEVMLELRGRGLVEPATIAGNSLHGLQEAAALVYPAARFRSVR